MTLGQETRRRINPPILRIAQGWVNE